MRVASTAESQAAQPAGAPSGTTFNGYWIAWCAASGANFKLRRLKLGVRGPAGSVTSDQHTTALYRQTVLPTGTGLTGPTAGYNLDQRGAADVTAGILYTTGTTAGTTGPTLGNLLEKLTMNTQTSWDVPWDYIEDFVCDQGTANGIAGVNIGNALPSSHLFTATMTVEA